MHIFHSPSILHELTDFFLLFLLSLAYLLLLFFKDMLGIVNLTSYVQPLSYKEIIYYNGKATSLSPLNMLLTWVFDTYMVLLCVGSFLLFLFC